MCSVFEGAAAAAEVVVAAERVAELVAEIGIAGDDMGESPLLPLVI